MNYHSLAHPLRSRWLARLIALPLSFALATAALVPSPAVQPSTHAQDDTRVVTGVIDDDHPFEPVEITVTRDNTTIIADMRPTSGDLDTLLYLVDSTGTIVAENDDRVLKKDSSSLIEFPAADAGVYRIIATRYKAAAGDTSGDFELVIRLERGIPEQPYRVNPDTLAELGYPTQDPLPVTEWTVLAYYGADNNLEGDIIADLNEFELAGGSTESVQIVALVDRNPEFDASNDNWVKTHLYHVTADTSGADGSEDMAPTIDSTLLADLGELDTADGETFAQFLVWAVTHYPAAHYVVAFGSHGAGWSGLIQDDTSDRDLLTLPELRKAFELGRAAAGVEQFELLINDACLMSSVEYFAALAPYFAFSLASPEVVVNPALDMTLLTNRLYNLRTPVEPGSLTNLGRDLVNRYILEDILLRDSSDVQYLTYALSDLDAFDPVVESVEAFATRINQQPAVHAPLLGAARANTYTYTPFLGGNTKVDLGSFMRRVIGLSTDPAIIAAAEDVLDALDAADLYGNAGENVINRTSYYNIYFPDTSKEFDHRYFAEGPLTEWAKMLRAYYNAMTPPIEAGAGIDLGIHLPGEPQITITSIYPPGDLSVLNPVTMQLEIVGRRISHGDFTVDQVIDAEGKARRLSFERILVDVLTDTGEIERINQWTPGVEVSFYSWDVALPRVTDGDEANFELLTITEELAVLDGRYKEPDSTVWNDVGVIFDLDGTFQSIINRSDTTDALAVIDEIPVGSDFQAYSSVVTADGIVGSEPGTTYTWPESGLTWTWEPAPSGDYRLGLLVTTFGGTTAYATAEKTVNNDAVDTTLRRDSWLQLGVMLPRRVDWERSVFDFDQRLARTQSPDETNAISLYIQPGVGQKANSIRQAFGQRADIKVFDLMLSDTIGGVEAKRIDYIRYLDAEDAAAAAENAGDLLNGASTDTPPHYIGQGYIVLSEQFDGGIIIAAEWLDEGSDQAGTLALLHDYVVIIKDDDVDDTSVWSVRPPRHRPDGFQVDYPMPKAWYEAIVEGWGEAQQQRKREDFLTPFEDGDWVRYPVEQPNSPTFVATRFAPADTTNIADWLDQVAADEVQPGTVRFERTNTHTYYGQNHTWEAALYRAERGSVAVQGRLYVTLFQGHAFIVWMETPDTDDAQEIMLTRFEPIIDGYKVIEDDTDADS